MTKRLYRSRDNRILAGVMGGIGDYFDIDPALIRLVYLLVTVFTGIAPGVLVYIVAILIVPVRPLMLSAKAESHDPEQV